MLRIFRIRKESSFFLATVLGSLVMGLALNAWYQAEKHLDTLLPKAEFAVFLSSTGLAAPDVTGKSIAAINGVTGVSFITQEQALAKALAASPDLQEVLIQGENPFSPYFAVRAYDIRSSNISDTIKKIAAVEGVEDVRYDAAVFATVEYLRDFARYYSAVLAIVVVAVVALIIGRFISKWFYRKVDYRRYAYLVFWGLLCGGAGALIYYLFTGFLIVSPVVQLPAKYLLALIPGGVLITLGWDK